MLGGIAPSSFAAIYAYMSDITAPEDRSKAFGLIGAAWAAGFVIGPAPGGIVQAASRYGGKGCSFGVGSKVPSTTGPPKSPALWQAWRMPGPHAAIAQPRLDRRSPMILPIESYL